jgi:hypothetical protein
MSGNTPNVSTTNGNGEGAGCPVNHGKGTPNVDNGAHSYDYKSDRNATSQECLYTTSNGVPMPHPYGTWCAFHDDVDWAESQHSFQRFSESVPTVPCCCRTST